jgi:biopolymer transport protein ExbD
MPTTLRRRRRSSGVDRADPNLTPLLDVVLQLITFFLMLVHFGTRIEGATDAVRLPVAPAALPDGDLGLDRLVVAIDAQGNLLVGDERRRGEAARAWWAEEARRRREGLAMVGRGGESPPTVVVVRGDRDAPLGVVREAIAAAERAGFARFSLVVLREVSR